MSDVALGQAGMNPLAAVRPFSQRARGARFYRANFGRILAGLDLVGGVALVAVLVLAREGTLLDASLRALLPYAFAAAVIAGVLREHDLYRFSVEASALSQLARTAGALAFAAPLGAGAGALAASMAGTASGEALTGSAATALVLAAALLAMHAAYGAIARILTRAGVFALNVVLVGATANARQLLARNAASRDLNVLAVFDDRLSRAPADIAGVPVLGDLDALLAWPALPAVDRIIVTVSTQARDRVRTLIERLRVAPNNVVLLLDIDGFEPTATSLAKVADAPAAYVSGAPADGRRAFWKRVQDLTFGSAILCVAAIPMLLIALAIKLDSRGPIFFRQPRHGFNNEIIEVWKFRSMRADAADHQAAQQVTRRDPRVTRVGAFIRKTSLDELPQLFNVLKGEMSLVGPRPHAVGMRTGDAESASLVAHYAHRHRIKPGMTGWAQIHGSRGPVHTADEVRARVRLDVDYIQRANFWLDLWIMLVTAPCLLGDSSADR
jgi:Undecaprenyl-phosphate glucose phosphotransferase